MNVSIVSSVHELFDLEAQIDDLAEHVETRNPFYESWMLIPAFKHLQNNEIKIVLVWSDKKTELLGLFPLEVKRGYHRVPVRYYSLWNHIHCFLSTPLVRKNKELFCLDIFFKWLSNQHFGKHLFQFDQIGIDEPFCLTLQSYLNSRDAISENVESYGRAMLNSRLPSEKYLLSAISAKHLKDLKKKKKKLAELGVLEFKQLLKFDDLELWIHDFLKLERSGWKGLANSAIDCDKRQREFLEDVLKGAFKRRSLAFFAMTLNDLPIAMRIGFISGGGVFSFKISFDERYARYSPGVLLEIEHIRYLLDCSDLKWADSCALPGSSMLNRLFRQKKNISSIAVATDTYLGRILVSTASHLKKLHENEFDLAIEDALTGKLEPKGGV